MPEERQTKTDGYKREYWNSLFTEIQWIQNRLHNWSLPHSENATDIEKMNLLLMYHQALTQKKYTKWFIGLTIANLGVVSIGLLVTFCIS